MASILVLASWFPNKDDLFNGDFVERHVKASALYQPVQLIFIKKSDSLKNGEEYIEKTVEGNLVCFKAYYGCKHPIKIIEQFLSNRKYNALQKKLMATVIGEYGLPSVVHVHMAMKAGPGALYLRKKYSIPYVVTENWTGYYPTSVPNISDYNTWYRWKLRNVLTGADLFLPVTQDLGSLVSKTVRSLKYQVVPNVVDTEKFYYQPSGREQRFRFIHASYLNYQKNPEAILRATARLVKEGYQFDLWLVGRKAPELEELAHTLHIESFITFKEAIPYSEVADLMRESSALLLFSRFENLPCVALEALCSGLPVVSSRVGGIHEVIDESNGLLVDPSNENELAIAMKSMIENYHQYNRVNIASRASDKFSYQVVGKTFKDIYLGLTNKTADRPQH